MIGISGVSDSRYLIHSKSSPNQTVECGTDFDDRFGTGKRNGVREDLAAKCRQRGRYAQVRCPPAAFVEDRKYRVLLRAPDRDESVRAGETSTGHKPCSPKDEESVASLRCRQARV